MQATNLKNKSVVVTGSTSGIGLAIAKEFAKQSCKIMLNGFGDAAEIEKIRATMAAENKTEVHYSPADMSKPVEIAAMMTQANKVFGGVDILINNAGIQFVSPIAEFPAEKWDAILAINLSSAFHTTKAALPGMKAKKWGRIINIASAHGLVASAYKSAYVAAKHGVVGLTKVTALEGAQEGITCNAICPGYVHTPLVEKQIDDQARANNIPRENVIRDIMLAKQPNKRFVTVEEIAAFSIFLCSEGGTSFNGAALAMDGGWVAE
ncbi:MAG: 3-hydroxybutyrate dehydrogenase [Burkholderiales bacterium]